MKEMLHSLYNNVTFIFSLIVLFVSSQFFMIKSGDAWWWLIPSAFLVFILAYILIGTFWYFERKIFGYNRNPD